MTNYKHIKAILDYGHRVKVTLKSDRIIVFNQIKSNGRLRGSGEEKLLKDALNEVGAIYWGDFEINDFHIKSIEPLPRRYKKLKVGDKVDILPIIKECEVYSGSDKKYKEMVGQKGLEIQLVKDGAAGIHYWVYAKDKSYSFCFPAYAVSPHIEEEEKEDMIDINGKKFSKDTIEEALKNYIK